MERHVDKYFAKTQNCVIGADAVANRGDTMVTYGVFLRHDVICAVDRAIEFLTEAAHPTPTITRHFVEGTMVPAEKPLFSFTGKLKDLVILETELLQHVGFACISAYNAYRMSLACPGVAFLDMHARHSTGTDMVLASAYGASVGSETAKRQGAKGFIGSSLDLTAPFYGTPKGLGTMPHVLIGYAGSTLEAVKQFVEYNPDDRNIVALVDYYGHEISDSLNVAEWFDHHLTDLRQTEQPYRLSVRLDTHGGRFAERLDYEKSVDVLSKWLHVDGEWSIVRAVMGEDVFEIANDSIRDRVRAILFGKGVSAANIINTRQTLDQNGHKKVQIVVSSGFNLFKCKIMSQARAPIDVIGTGSFLPETLSETYATCDAVAFNGRPSVKVGREFLMNAVLGT